LIGMRQTNEIPLSAELVRKGIHLFALVIPAGYYLLPFSLALGVVALAAAVSIVIDLSRFRRWPLWSWVSKILTPIIREHEITGGFTGASYILTTSTFCILLFPKMVAIASIVFIIVGDIAAALVGRVYGRHKLVANKSVEGSGACLLSLVVVAFLIPELPLWAGLVGAVVATAAEAFSGRIDDNLAVPLASGAAMLALMYFSGYEHARLFDALIAAING